MSASQIHRIAGRARPLRGDDIDTDRIMPARFLRAITFTGLEHHVFEDDRRLAREAGHVHAFDDRRFAGAEVLVVNRNFGCGSSREHAPQGLVRSGIRAIVGESFSEIFFGNAVMLGLTAVTAPPSDIEAVQQLVERDPSVELVIDLDRLELQVGSHTVPVQMPAPAREALLTGHWDGLGLLLHDFDQVRQTAARLPYLRAFTP
jgi:3-isopropylmalate/(R)-2-methylmalate dehydratase small subunit